jgi:hypothetical protein
VGYTRNSKVARIEFRTQDQLHALKAQVQELSARTQ